MHLGFFRNGLEDLRAPLRRDILPVRMPVDSSPFLEAKQGILVFQHKVVGNGLDLLIGIWKTGLQVSSQTCDFTDLIIQIGGSEEEPVCPGDGNRTFADNRISFLLGSALSAAICWENFAGCRIQSSDKRTFGSRLLLLPVPVRNGFIDVSDPAALIQLLDRCHPAQPPANPCYVL